MPPPPLPPLLLLPSPTIYFVCGLPIVWCSSAPSAYTSCRVPSLCRATPSLPTPAAHPSSSIPPYTSPQPSSLCRWRGRARPLSNWSPPSPPSRCRRWSPPPPPSSLLPLPLLPSFYALISQPDPSRVLFSPLSLPPAWLSSLRSLSSSPFSPSLGHSTLLLGPRNAGKSSFSLLLLNSLLSRYARVAYLDADVGQSAFSPPGTVSLSLLSRPAFGPPHSLQRGSEERGPAPPASLERAYFIGDVQIKARVRRYVRALSLLLSHYRTALSPSSALGEAVPLIVNTAGYLSGMGEWATERLMEEMKPAFVVYLGGGEREKEAMPPFLLPLLSPSSSSPSASSSFPSPSSSPILFSLPRYRPLHPLLHSRVEAHQLRTLSLLSYFLRRASPSPPLSFATAGLLLARERPYKVKWEDVEVGFLNEEGGKVEREYAGMAINGAIVGLCRKEEEEEEGGRGRKKRKEREEEKGSFRIYEGDLSLSPLQCFGLAIVRGVDVEQRTLLLLTPVDPALLEKVNVLLKGQMELPALFFHLPQAYEQIPFCLHNVMGAGGRDEEGAAGGAQVKPKHHLQRKRLMNKH